MKLCSQCGEQKPLDMFYRYSKGQFGRRAACKACCYKKYGELWRRKALEWGRNNQDRSRAKAMAYQRADEERMRSSIQRLRQWREKNRERFIAVDRSHGRARYARKLQAMPEWANQFFITEAYELARLRTKLTGIKWHVDHIVPLRSKLVCGFHSEANLRVIQASSNCRKSNRTWPDMP